MLGSSPCLPTERRWGVEKGPAMTSTVQIARSSFASTTADKAWEVLSQKNAEARPDADSLRDGG